MNSGVAISTNSAIADPLSSLFLFTNGYAFTLHLDC
ncbi:MAG: hypothetical protein RLZZ448_558 [Actinomycetota bacterium]